MKYLTIFWAISFVLALVVALLNANAALTISSVLILLVSAFGIAYTLLQGRRRPRK